MFKMQNYPQKMISTIKQLNNYQYCFNYKQDRRHFENASYLLLNYLLYKVIIGQIISSNEIPPC